MSLRQNRLVRPAYDAGGRLRRRVEALLTRGLRQELAQLRAEQAEALSRLHARHAEAAEALARLGAALERLSQGQARLQERLLQEIAASGRRLAEPDPGRTWLAVLHGIGVLNYEDSVVSGERRFLERYFRQAPAAVVLDVGANAGQFAELARECGPEATIHCFEPHPRAFAALAARAGELGVTAHRLALSDAEGEAAFFDYADEPGSQHASLYREVIEGVHGRPADAVRVRCATLDALAPRLGLDRIGLLKIDTEGHELAVLKGARGLLERGAIDVIQFEFNEMNVVSRVFMKDFFDLLPGYRLYRLLPRGAIELARYDPRSMEIFAYQNIAGIRRDLDPGWVTAEDPA